MLTSEKARTADARRPFGVTDEQMAVGVRRRGAVGAAAGVLAGSWARTCVMEASVTTSFTPLANGPSSTRFRIDSIAAFAVEVS
jgi:hypothetical protein